jgi:hypothetical protein
MNLVLVATTLAFASWAALSRLAQRLRPCASAVAVESSRARRVPRR